MIWNYKILDINLDFDRLIDYYRQLENSWSHKKWTLDENVLDAGKHEAKKAYGWGLQSNLPNLNDTCPPYNVSKIKLDYYRDTDLIFGYVKDLKDQFPQSTQWSVAGHPPGTKISLHTDSSNYLKVHIPIVTNDQAYFVFEDEKVVLETGKVYLINTLVLHGTENLGNTDRVHLFFKILSDKINTV